MEGAICDFDSRLLYSNETRIISTKLCNIKAVEELNELTNGIQCDSISFMLGLENGLGGGGSLS